MIRKVFLLVLLNLSVAPAYSDNIYVAFKWAAPADKSFTESWVIIDTKYNTDTALGMQLLTNELAKLKNTKTVIIYYIRNLKGNESPNLERGGEIRV